MTDFASHVRIFEANPTDDFVEKRSRAVDALVSLFKKPSSYSDLLSLANDIAAAFSVRGRLSEGLAGQAEAALQGESASFILEGHELEAKACVGLAAARYLEGASATSFGAASKVEVVALGLWSALAFQKPLSELKIERLRAEILAIARDIGVRAAENCRQRVVVPDVKFSIPEADGIGGIEKQWKAGPQKALDALRTNAALDREEIDLLWWVLSDWSIDFQERFTAMSEPLAPIAAALELVRHLKRMPAEAHKNLLLRLVHDKGAKNLAELVGAMDSYRSVLADGISRNPIVCSNPAVFPLLSTICDPQQKPSGSKEVRGLAEWSARALLEAGLSRISQVSNPIS